MVVESCCVRACVCSCLKSRHGECPTPCRTVPQIAASCRGTTASWGPSCFRRGCADNKLNDLKGQEKDLISKAYEVRDMPDGQDKDMAKADLIDEAKALEHATGAAPCDGASLHSFSA